MILHTVHCTRHPAYGKWVWSGMMGGGIKPNSLWLKKNRRNFFYIFKNKQKSYLWADWSFAQLLFTSPFALQSLILCNLLPELREFNGKTLLWAWPLLQECYRKCLRIDYDTSKKRLVFYFKYLHCQYIKHFQILLLVVCACSVAQ